jgi:thiamine pyrophosphate-dependent acetolactate synthase large subunit-like protein
MPLRTALEVLQAVRVNEVVFTTMGAAREWAAISWHPLDFCHIPSCMGHTSAIGLGLALARPERHVIVLNGDGSMLMSLGNLVTIAAAAPENFTLIVSDNGVYEVTGRQRATGAGIDYVGLARAAGLASAWCFDDLPTWRRAVREALDSPGPRLIQLRVEPNWDEENLAVPMREPITGQIARLRENLIANSECGIRNAEHA